MSKRQKFPIVHIQFLDHYQSDGTDYRPIPCEISAFLVGEDEAAYYLCWWMCDSNPGDHNSESITIIKHPGLKIRRLK